MYEEPSVIAGDFSMVKSVGQLDGTIDPKQWPRQIVTLHNPIAGSYDLSFFNTAGPVSVSVSEGD